eukprot:jgi/Botrbrau1/17710/Bobra.0166s0132.1
MNWSILCLVTSPVTCHQKRCSSYSYLNGITRDLYDMRSQYTLRMVVPRIPAVRAIPGQPRNGSVLVRSMLVSLANWPRIVATSTVGDCCVLFLETL